MNGEIYSCLGSVEIVITYYIYILHIKRNNIKKTLYLH